MATTTTATKPTSPTNWHNPYTGDNHKATLAKMNRERVQRRRTEWEFMKNIDKQFDIKNLDEMRSQVAAAAAQEEQSPNSVPPALGSRKILGGSGNGKKKSKAAVLPDILEFSFFLPADNVRCLAVAHGGASLWTSEKDGSISIRNGATGQVAFTIAAPPPPPPAEGGADANSNKEAAGADVVSTLYAPEEGTQMWVGTDNGTVRVYDSRIFVRLHEATHPVGPVSCFVSSFNGRTFSAAGNSIIKWGTAEQKFAVLLELQHSTKVAAMRTHGYYLFVAGDNEIVSYDGETGQGKKAFRGHLGNITCLVIQAGLLLSGSTDGSVRAWEVETAEEVASLILPEREDALRSSASAGADGAASSSQQDEKDLLAIVDIIADQVTGQVWSIDRRGSIDIWSASSTGRFSFVRHIQGRIPSGAAADGGAVQQGVKQVTGAVAVDTSKIWTLGSNGQNIVWHSTHNVMESQMAVAAVQMERELEEAHKEMAQWREFIRTRQVVYENLRQVLADRAAAMNEKITMGSYYNKWLRWVDERKRKNRQAAATEIVAVDSDRHVQWNFFEQWVTYVRQKQSERAKEQLVATLRRAADNARIVGQARQLLNFARQMQHQRRLQAVVDGLARMSEHNTRSSVWRKWMAFRVKQTTPYNKGERSTILASFADKQLMRQRYMTLLGWALRCRRRKMAEKRAETVNRAGENELRARGFTDLRVHSDKSIRKKLLLKQVDALEQRNISSLMSEYYTLWYRYWAQKKGDRLKKEMDDTMEELQGYRDKFKLIEHLHRRKVLLDHAESQRVKAEEALEATRKAQKDTRQDIADLEKELDAKRNGERQAIEKSITEQVDDLISMLKTKTINLHQDFALTSTIIKKWQSSSQERPAAKMFLESHAALKRLIVTWTGQMHLPATEEWPITEDLVKEKLAQHEIAAVLDSVKTMVVTFDLMEPTERSSLDTDGEIQINAKWVGFLADYCLEQRQKRLGDVAHRVK